MGSVDIGGIEGREIEMSFDIYRHVQTLVKNNYQVSRWITVL